jgi:hypothetical protein
MPQQDNDLVSLLENEYLNLLQLQVPENEKESVKVPTEVEDFLAFARNYLKGNQPTTVEYGAAGMAVRMQKGQIVTIGPPTEMVTADNRYMPFSRFETGRGELPPANDMPITRGDLGRQPPLAKK